jgi:hypothetical protein
MTMGDGQLVMGDVMGRCEYLHRPRPTWIVFDPYLTTEVVIERTIDDVIGRLTYRRQNAKSAIPSGSSSDEAGSRQ